MELIDKAAVAAEIERLSAYFDSLHEQRIIEKILSIINTLEVKEVDLEKDIKNAFKAGFELGLKRKEVRHELQQKQPSKGRNRM